MNFLSRSGIRGALRNLVMPVLSIRLSFNAHREHSYEYIVGSDKVGCRHLSLVSDVKKMLLYRSTYLPARARTHASCSDLRIQIDLCRCQKDTNVTFLQHVRQ